jgi:hypothetical protein
MIRTDHAAFVIKPKRDNHLSHREMRLDLINRIAACPPRSQIRVRPTQ